MIARETISQNYIRGKGIEIGAFHNPFPVRPPHLVSYVDMRTKRELIEGFPEIKNHQAIPETDIVDDGQTLATLANESFDFLISSHQLEHCWSPLRAIQNHLRVIKKSGVIFYAIPDHENHIDKNRKVSDLECVLEDYFTTDPNEKRKRILRHYDEYLSSVDKIEDTETRFKIANDRINNNLDIHFHCWNSNGLLELFQHVTATHPVELELFYKNDHEYFVVLRKTGGSCES